MRYICNNGWLIIFWLFIYSSGISQTYVYPVNEPKVILITLDGFRWQELFNGADPNIIRNVEYVSDTAALINDFWRDDKILRRKALLPFFWDVMAREGQLYGNRDQDNKVNLTNQMWFSYPGYSEILCGFADDVHIRSNDKTNNPNETVLEYINNKPGFNGNTAAFTSWDVFPYIINQERSHIPVNAGYTPVEKPFSAEDRLINQLQKQTPVLWNSVRLDAFTFHLALSYIKNAKPKLLYISFGETDDFAHEGDYDQYLYSANRTDAFIREIWNTIQADPFYKNQTTMILTTDHGRGIDPEGWKHHGKSSVANSDEVWMAFLGVGVAPKGEIKKRMQIHSNQIAATIAALLGYEYTDKAGTSLINELKSK